MTYRTKTPIKDLLNPEEKKVLEELYLSYRVPTDQLRRCSDILILISSGFERLTSRRLEPGHLLRYMFNRRKDKDWPKLGKRSKKFESLFDFLTKDQIEALKKAYEQIRKPVDDYQFNTTLANDLGKLFHKFTGSSERGELLVAVMTSHRKRGEWPTLFEDVETGINNSFGDIVEVQQKYKKGS